SDKDVIAGVDAQRDAIEQVVAFVHAHPELAHEEHECAAELVRRLRDAGLEVEEHVAGLDTAFRAVLRGDQPGRRVGIVAQYDAALYSHPEFIDTVSQASLWMRRDHFIVAGIRSLRDDVVQTPLDALGALLQVAYEVPRSRLMIEHLVLDGDVEEGTGLVLTG